MQWFDIGANLTSARLQPVEPVVQQALAANVSHIAVTGTSVLESQQALALTKQCPRNLVSTAGVHPHYAKDVEDNYLHQLAELAQQPKVVAIGECGLDFNRNFSPKAKQISVFSDQLKLAQSLDMPVFLHERDAFSEQLMLLKQYEICRGVAHCFTGNIEQMRAYLDLGLYIGITGWVCDPKKGETLREAVKQLPLERLLLETDAPYLLPKGIEANHKINVPANLPFIAKTVANLMQRGISELSQASCANAIRLFGLSE